jgi:uncharacterized membrane protein HdeD (DUF308 family)
MTTETSNSGGGQSSSVQVVIWVTLVRGVLAITLGLALLIQPVKVRPFLITSMGMFWLVSGVMSIRWGLSGRRARGMPLLAGIVSVLAGLSAMSRRFEVLDAVVSDTLAITMLGAAILLTGLMHMLGGFRTGEETTRQLSRLSILLGIFEVVLGTALVLEPLDQGIVIYVGASIWAIVGGIILIGDALRLRSKTRAALRPDRSSDDSSPI